MGYTSPTTKAKIVALKREGLSTRAIAARVGTHATTVSRVFNRYGENEDYDHLKPKPGRRRKLSARDTRRATRLLASRKALNASDLQRKLFPDVSTSTIRRRLVEAGLKAYKPRRKPLLTRAHIKQRLEWAKEHRDWTNEDWDRVFFTDEAPFLLFKTDASQWVWRKPGQELDPRYIQPTVKLVKGGGGKVRVWGCMSAQGLGRLVRIIGNLNAQLYVDILEDDALGSLESLEIDKDDFYYQQDNDPSHTSKPALSWFLENGIRLLRWPPHSPDMNIIEHIWAYLGRRVRMRPSPPTNLEALWSALAEEWEAIEPGFIRKLFDSMPERVAALLKAKGGHTRY